MTRVFGLLTFYCVLNFTDCLLLKCFYRIDHTTWSDGLDCPVQHYNASPVLLKREDSGQIDSGSRHIEHIAGIWNPRRHIFSKSRHRYYQNANSTFQCQRLLKCGDINPNPGPTKYPCACCERPCKINQRALQCDGCNSWCHAKCTRVSQDEYNRLSSTDDTWYCNACTFKWLSDSFFSDSTEESLNNSNSTNSDTSETNVIADYKASIAAYYKFNLSIAHQNINSLQNKMDEIRVLLNQELFDILVLTETKIDSSYNNSLFQHPLYRIIRRDRKKGGGGIMVYIKHSVSACRRRKLEPVDIEAVCIDVKGRGNTWFSLLACYRSPNKNKPTEFLSTLYSTTENLYNHRNELLIIGDLNFNMLNNDSCSPDNRLSEYCDRFQLTNIVTVPTRITDTSSTLLDVILTTHPQ